MLGAISSLKGSSSGYKIPNSLRFRSSASAYLSKTPTVTGNRKTWTWSGWVKRGALSTGYIFNAGVTSDNTGILLNDALSSRLQLNVLVSSVQKIVCYTSSALRDPSAWYHIVVAVDTTQATNSDGVKMYVNGTQQTLTFSSYTQNIDTSINFTNIHYLANSNSSERFDGYLAEVNFIDGQALTPSSFGAVSPQTGVWAPKAYTGTYGTNGFYLKFNDNSAATSAAIGKDYSGNYNSWTPNNISLIAGSTYDSMTDTPTPYVDALQYFAGTRYPYNALNFRSAASTYLSRTFGTPTSQSVWTYSAWVKRRSIGLSPDTRIFNAWDGSAAVSGYIIFDSVDAIRLNASSSDQPTITTSVYRDTSVWYHIVASVNMAAGIQTIYVDGVQVATRAVSNVASQINKSGSAHRIGGSVLTTVPYFDGYLAEVNFIDGQALDASSFGQTVDGVWKPKTYTGTYGTNGFYLKFNDNSAATAAALGNDSAGTNDWTPTNLAVTDVTSTEITSRSLVNPSYGLQFTAADSSRLSRTPASLTNATTNTWSGWVKRTVIGTLETFWAAGTAIGNNAAFSFTATNQIALSQNVGGGGVVYYRQSNQTFTDLSKWYHITLVVDTTNSTAQNRARIWVDGAEITSWLTNATIPLNTTFYWNAAAFHTLGTNNGGTGSITQYFDGYLAEINFIDGQALYASSFGETIDGTWVPKTYSGAYGTNGFYLNFADRSAMTAAAIGNDTSSNSNNWTPTNLVITDAIDYTAKSARGNYSVINRNLYNMGINLSINSTEGNLNLLRYSIGWARAIGTIGVSSGKWYFEVTPTNNTAYQIIGVGQEFSNILNHPGFDSTSWGFYTNNGNKYYNNASTAYGTYIAGQTVGVAFDMDSGKIWFSVAGTWQASGNPETGTNYAFTGLTGTVFPHIGLYADNASIVNTSAVTNFGQRPFTYTPPTGFLALNTQNLPVPTIKNGALYTAATTYTGTGVSRSISNTVNNKSFQPDLVWIKGRSGATDHALYDSVRGAQKDLVSNTTAAETTQATGLLSFDAAGATIGALAKLNTNAATYVAWQWKAGDTTVSNTAGTITSQVNAGTDQGFSIVSYTGTGANATVGHGLGVAPKMIITKDRDTVVNWVVYHESMGGTSFARFNTTDAKVTDATIYNGTPSSTVFNIGYNNGINGSTKRMISYCFAEIAGYSKFGSYTGNGSADGPFVYCGFKPRWILFKSITGGTVDHNWGMFDTTRESWNVSDTIINANTSTAEILASVNPFDFVSNGFKIRGTGVASNTSGATYIFAAFAENPIKYALAR